MRQALSHPAHGYYATRDPLGRAGDFVTAPEVSQIFGEMLGLWCADMWQRAGSPELLRLVELGPGRGTLIADALRATRVVPGFGEAACVHLVETSPVLVGRQRDTLGDVNANWHESLDDVPEGSALVLANEFFDALPIQQFVRTADGWGERRVTVADDGGLAFVCDAGPVPADLPAECSVGAICERGPAAVAVMTQIAQRLCRNGGAALMVDYGYFSSGFGETLQAVRGHASADPLASPGEADLTAHVDFAALADAARRQGAAVFGPVAQGDFLRRVGAEARAAALCRGPASADRTAIVAGLQRLMDPAQMGSLFKVMCFAHPAWPVPDGVQ